MVGSGTRLLCVPEDEVLAVEEAATQTRPPLPCPSLPRIPGHYASAVSSRLSQQQPHDSSRLPPSSCCSSEPPQLIVCSARRLLQSPLSHLRQPMTLQTNESVRKKTLFRRPALPRLQGPPKKRASPSPRLQPPPLAVVPPTTSIQHANEKKWRAVVKCPFASLDDPRRNRRKHLRGAPKKPLQIGPSTIRR